MAAALAYRAIHAASPLRSPTGLACLKARPPVHIRASNRASPVVLLRPSEAPRSLRHYRASRLAHQIVAFPALPAQAAAAPARPRRRLLPVRAMATATNATAGDTPGKVSN
ncbi:unnamed protein product [Closterium sp. NIES-54]